MYPIIIFSPLWRALYFFFMPIIVAWQLLECHSNRILTNYCVKPICRNHFPGVDEEMRESSGKGSWLELLPQRSGCRMGWSVEDPPVSCSFLFIFVLCTAPAWVLCPIFSFQTGFLNVGKGSVGGGIQELNAAWSIKALGVFHRQIKGELITKISVTKNKPPGDFSVSDQGSQEIKCEIQAVKS